LAQNRSAAYQWFILSSSQIPRPVCRPDTGAQPEHLSGFSRTPPPLRRTSASIMACSRTGGSTQALQNGQQNPSCMPPAEFTLNSTLRVRILVDTPCRQHTGTGNPIAFIRTITSSL
jgi:hypothetical protein